MHNQEVAVNDRREETRNDREIKAIMKLLHVKEDLKNARIKSAIEKGKQTMLTSESKGVSLSKFEHKSKQGNLVVYTQDGATDHKKRVNYKVITSFRPPNSLRNQLFFAADLSLNSRRSEHETALSIQAKTRNRKPRTRMKTHSKSKAVLPNLNQPVSKLEEQPDSFEQILTKYKTKREREKRLLGLGAQHTEFAEKLGNLYIERKNERNRMRARLSVSENIRLEYEKEEKSEADLTREMNKLPTIKFKIDEAKDGTGKNEMASDSVLDLRHNRLLKVPPKKRPKRTLPKLSRKELLADLHHYKAQFPTQYETVPIKLPKI